MSLTTWLNKYIITKVYFPGLNGLRFIAAFCVLLHHLEVVKAEFGFTRLSWPIYNILGELAVSFFFVLSGFLITYLLLTEQQSSGSISIRKFYMRRMLKIWPLYYLLVFLGFAVLPSIEIMDNPKWSDATFDGIGTKLVLFLTLFPNVAYYMFKPVAHILQLWSIGVEEQFYLFWPILVKYVRSKLLVILLVLFGVWIFKLGFAFYREFINDSYQLRLWWRIANYMRFHLMAFGALGAYGLYHQKAIVQRLFTLRFQIVMYALLLACLISGFEPLYVSHEFYAIFFLAIILNVSSNPRSLLKLEHKWLNYLGKISYGIYMYHLMCIGLVIGTMRFFDLQNLSSSMFENFIYYVFSIICTLLISDLSYKYFEKPFIKLKGKVAVIKSGDQAIDN